MKLGIDLDGVICSYGEHEHDTRTYPWWEPSTYLERDLVPDAAEAIELLRGDGYDIHVITARGCHDNTYIWMNNVGLGHLPVTHTENKWLVPCNVYLDDGVRFLNDLWSRRCLTVRFEYPHNQHAHYDFSVADWWDFVSLVNNPDFKPGKLRTMPRRRRKVKAHA